MVFCRQILKRKLDHYRSIITLAISYNSYFLLAQYCTQNYALPLLQMFLYRESLPPVGSVLNHMRPQSATTHPLGKELEDITPS